MSGVTRTGEVCFTALMSGLTIEEKQEEKNDKICRIGRLFSRGVVAQVDREIFSDKDLLKESYQGKPLWLLYLMTAFHTEGGYYVPEFGVTVLNLLNAEDLRHPEFPGVSILERSMGLKHPYFNPARHKDFICALVDKGIYQVKSYLLMELHSWIAPTHIIELGNWSFPHSYDETIYVEDLKNPVFRRIEELSSEELKQPGPKGETAFKLASEYECDSGCQALVRHIQRKICP